MFSFCANYSYIPMMPMAMPFGTCCRGGGNSFWGSFVGAFMGASMAGGGASFYNSSYFGGYQMPVWGGFQPLYSTPMQSYQPLFSANSFMQPTFDLTMPQMAMPTMPTFDYSTSALSSSSFASSYSDAANYNPFAAPKSAGSKFDSDDYLKGKSEEKDTSKAKRTSSKVTKPSLKTKGYALSSINTGANLPQLKAVGYNAEKGERLAREALAGVVGFDNGECGTSVREALERSDLDNGKRTGSAADFGDVLLTQKNFKEISTKGLDLSSLPGGCALVYGRGVAGYSSEHGHVEITLGDGRAASDGITNNIRPGARVFVPV